VKAYWDEKDNPKPMDEVVDRLVKKYQAQKLWNRVRDELGYSIDCCDEIVDLVEKWIPKEQIAAGSQNVNTELLVDGFNDCVRKMKEMLR
jgi:oligoribonuclease (3'-5' exoribonuclease)